MVEDAPLTAHFVRRSALVAQGLRGARGQDAFSAGIGNALSQAVARSEGTHMRVTDADETAPESDRFVTAGVDVGMRTVKVALLAHGGATGSPRVLSSELVTVARRREVLDLQNAVREGWFGSLRGAGLVPADIALVASTGHDDGFARVGHFYRAQSLSAGVRFLFPHAVAVLDVGARQLRCTRLERMGRGRGYAATPQGESWGADALEPIGSAHAASPAEMIRGPAAIAAYESVAARASALMQALSLDGPTAITGALAVDVRFLSTLAQRLIDDRLAVVLLSSPDAVFTSAYGAALLAARRFLRAAGSRRGKELSPSRAWPWPRPRLLN